MKDSQPLYDTATRYRVEIEGRVDTAWLESFYGSAQVIIDAARQQEDITVFEVHADQAGIVGLLRRLHGLGITIRQFQIM